MKAGREYPEAASPVSRRVRVSTIPRSGIQVVIDADATQRAALAEAHGLLEVNIFEADLLAERWGRDGASLNGRVRASIVQQCIVTLEPTTAEIDEAIDLVLVPEDPVPTHETESAAEIVLDADGPDDPDTFSGDEMDAGAIAEEFFALAIDPYPRKPGAEIAGTEPDFDAEDRASPFARLAELKRND